MLRFEPELKLGVGVGVGVGVEDNELLSLNDDLLLDTTTANTAVIVMAAIIFTVNSIIFYPTIVLLIRRRHDRALKYRSLPSLLCFLIYFYLFSIVQLANIVFGQQHRYLCVVSEVFYVLIFYFIQHFLLIVPTTVFQSNLNQRKLLGGSLPDMRVARLFLRPKVKAAITVFMGTINVVLYLFLHYFTNLPGDCNRTALVAYVSSITLFLISVFYFVIQLYYVKDPFFIRFEFMIEVICHVPGSYALTLVYVIVPDLFPPWFDYRWLFAVNSLIMNVTSGVFPLCLTNDKILNCLNSTTTNDMLSGSDLVYHSQSDNNSNNDKNHVMRKLASSHNSDLFRIILNNQIMLDAYTQFSVRDWSVENILFYQAITMQYKNSFESVDVADSIYHKFIKLGSSVEINIDHETRKKITTAVANRQITSDMFDEALTTITSIIENDTLPKWKLTTSFKDAIERATFANPSLSTSCSGSHIQLSNSQSLV